MIVDTIDRIDGSMMSSHMADKKRKKSTAKTTSTTLQIVMKARQEKLLEQLAELKGVPKSTILVECARRVVDKYQHLLADDNTQN